MKFRPPFPLLRRGRVLLAAAVLAGAGLARAQDGAAVSVDGTMPEDFLPGLRQLIRSSLKLSPTMVMQAISVAQAQVGIMQADSNLMPRLSASSSYGVSRQEVSQSGFASQPSSSRSLSYSANFSQNVFSWGQYLDASRIARIQELMAERRFDDAYGTLVAQIREGYIGLIVAKANLKVVRTQLKQAQTALTVAQMQEKNGALPPAAMGGPILAEGNARLSADRAEEEYLHASRVLAILAGVPAIDDDAVPEEVPTPVYSPPKAQALLATILRDRGTTFFQEQVYDLAIKADKLNYRAAATGLLPKFSLGASDSLSNYTTVSIGGVDPVTGKPLSVATQTGVNSLYYGLNMNWQIFDGLATHAAKRQALEQRRVDERNLRDVVAREAEEAQDDERQVDFAARAMELASTQAAYAANSALQTASNVKYGSQSQADLMTADATLYSYQYTEAVDRSQFFSRWCRLVYLAGLDPAMNYLPVHYVRGTR